MGVIIPPIEDEYATDKIKIFENIHHPSDLKNYLLLKI